MRDPLPRAQRPRFRPLPLPLWLRATVVVLGWLLVVLGVIGLFLPVLQGGLLLALGFALLSISSPRFHLWLRSWMGRWPGIWKRMERLRRRLHGWLHRTAGPTPPTSPDAS